MRKSNIGNVLAVVFGLSLVMIAFFTFFVKNVSENEHGVIYDNSNNLARSFGPGLNLVLPTDDVYLYSNSDINLGDEKAFLPARLVLVGQESYVDTYASVSISFDDAIAYAQDHQDSLWGTNNIQEQVVRRITEEIGRMYDNGDLGRIKYTVESAPAIYTDTTSADSYLADVAAGITPPKSKYHFECWTAEGYFDPEPMKNAFVTAAGLSEYSSLTIQIDERTTQYRNTSLPCNVGPPVEML